MTTEKKNTILNYTDNEIKKANLQNTEIGSFLYEFVNKILNITNSDTNANTQILNVTKNLLELQPITALTEEDFDYQKVDVGHGKYTDVKVCNRYPSVYQDEDNLYYDDKAVIYIIKDRPEVGEVCLYQNGYSSKQQIELPYIPNPTIISITADEAGFHNFKK